jgi:hypothetical protein
MAQKAMFRSATPVSISLRQLGSPAQAVSQEAGATDCPAASRQAPDSGIARGHRCGSPR